MLFLSARFIAAKRDRIVSKTKMTLVVVSEGFIFVTTSHWVRIHCDIKIGIQGDRNCVR